jgi:uncharacterized membrane protein
MTESHLVAVVFDDEYKADEARVALRRMQGEGLGLLDETAVVVQGLDGKVALNQDLDPVAKRKNQGHWLGILAALATGVQPLILAGTAAGAVVGKLTDHGISTRIMKDIGESLRPGTSALFILGRRTGGRDRIIERLRPFGGKIAHTSFSAEAERELVEAYEGGSQ